LWKAKRGQVDEEQKGVREEQKGEEQKGVRRSKKGAGRVLSLFGLARKRNDRKMRPCHTN
jgi:hypothetical protein